MIKCNFTILSPSVGISSDQGLLSVLLSKEKGAALAAPLLFSLAQLTPQLQPHRKAYGEHPNAVPHNDSVDPLPQLS